MRSLGLTLVLAGLVLVLLGVLVWGGWLNWLGRLPGDLRIEREGFRLYIPFTSMILVSLALTLLLHFMRRFFG